MIEAFHERNVLGGEALDGHDFVDEKMWDRAVHVSEVQVGYHKLAPAVAGPIECSV